jgi:hypothetical protein
MILVKLVQVIASDSHYGPYLMVSEAVLRTVTWPRGFVKPQGQPRYITPFEMNSCKSKLRTCRYASRPTLMGSDRDQ